MLIDWNAIGSVSTALALVVGVGDKNVKMGSDTIKILSIKINGLNKYDV
jgi:hypothetical protein